jgi:SAM-dependent methyltransferase
MTEPAPQTWHHGLVARWWAEVNVDGPEIEFYRPFVEAGQPALDAGCGTGRLLIPWLRTGLDVDGADVSPDMLAMCQSRAESEGLPIPNLYAQPMHELDLPRRYRTIVVCGAFGLGGQREHDAEGLRRLYEHLEPGGTLLLDNEVPYANWWWRYWRKDERAELPRPWKDEGDRRPMADGSELELRIRLVELDPLAQRVALEIRAFHWDGANLLEEEKHRIEMVMYFTDELALMLEQAGFADVEVRAGYEDRSPTADDDFVVFIARRPGSRR